MKKILTLFLAICMLISIIPMAVSAETIIEPATPAENITTVYVGDDIAETYTPDGTRSKPYKDFETAYTEAIKIGSGDIKIVIMDSVYAMDTASSSNTASNNAKFMLKQYLGGIVFVCGEADPNGVYPTIDFAHRTATKATLFSIGADMVFDNLQLTNTTNQNTWVSAALYDLTLGENISMPGTYSGKVSLTGSCWDTNNDDYVDTRKNGTIISIYNGTYNGEVYAGVRGTKPYDIAANDNITLNIYGGTFAKIFGTKNDQSVADDIALTINMYGGNVNTELNGYRSSATCYLNVYNDSFDTSSDNSKYKGNFDKINTSPIIPTEHVKYAGVQNTEPDGTYSVRFVGTISDYTQFTNIGFRITASNGKTYTKDCSKVYESIDDGDSTPSTKDDLGGYIFAMAITDIPTTVENEELSVTFKVQPYVVKDSVTYYGTAYTVTYNAGSYVSSSAIAN